MYFFLPAAIVDTSSGFLMVPMNFLPDIDQFELLCFIVCLNSGGILPPYIPNPLAPTILPLGFFFMFFICSFAFDIFFIGGNCIYNIKLRVQVTLRVSSSELKVWLLFLPSPLIMSFNSGNFLVVGSTFFLSTLFVVFFFEKLLF